jgi:hypothetical protein
MRCGLFDQTRRVLLLPVLAKIFMGQCVPFCLDLLGKWKLDFDGKVILATWIEIQDVERTSVNGAISRVRRIDRV